MNPTSTDNNDTALERLLNRTDIWRGDSRLFLPQIALDSGYADINASLVNNGWPTRSLVEVCQKGFQQQELILFAPVLAAGTGYIVLLNPPTLPFCQALIQAGINLERVIVVQVGNKADFLASFVELARTESCEVLLAWQQHQTFSYTELRKCSLATNEGAALCVLFRPDSAQLQSSPAVLRISTEIRPTDIQLKILKQKGVPQQRQSEPIKLLLPNAWQGLLPYHLLDQTSLDQTLLPGHSSAATAKRKSATVMPIKKRK
jgi:cell division inhibitor SulA